MSTIVRSLAPASVDAGTAATTPPPRPDTDTGPHHSPARSPLHEAILRTLLYYDIWEHPLTVSELALFLPLRLRERADLEAGIGEAMAAGTIAVAGEFCFPAHRPRTVVGERVARERRARRYWHVARLVMHIIKRTPFVRAVMVSGELSKNVWSRGGDIDFFILTEPGRLWIARTLLVLFKKSVLLNRKKFFCLNYFATTAALEEPDRNIYVATEVAHVKPLFNAVLYRRYLDHNRWTALFFPNFMPHALPAPMVNDSPSRVQRIFEKAFSILPLDRLDGWLLSVWREVWVRRYAHLSEEARAKAFTTSDNVSRAYAGDFQERILAEYRRRLDRYGLS